MKRIIRPASDGGTPRTQSDTLPTSAQSDYVLSDPPDVSDAFMSDGVGAAPAEHAPQQNVDTNALLMQQMMQLHVHPGPRTAPTPNNNTAFAY